MASHKKALANGIAVLTDAVFGIRPALALELRQAGSHLALCERRIGESSPPERSRYVRNNAQGAYAGERGPAIWVAARATQPSVGCEF